MYDELIKNLRGRSQFLLPHYGEETSYDSDLMKQAADAIEELQKRVPKVPHGRLIEEADAIETAWMILRGLGYFKEENQQLEQTVREVFATAPVIEVE